jgi:hypothetical protein
LIELGDRGGVNVNFDMTKRAILDALEEKFEQVGVRCSHCSGSGSVPAYPGATQSRTCDRCHGLARELPVKTIGGVCDTCLGKGKVERYVNGPGGGETYLDICPQCHDPGVELQTFELDEVDSLFDDVETIEPEKTEPNHDLNWQETNRRSILIHRILDECEGWEQFISRGAAIEYFERYFAENPRRFYHGLSLLDTNDEKQLREFSMIIGSRATAHFETMSKQVGLN